MSSTIKSWIDVFSGKHRPVWLGNIDTDRKRGHSEPQRINLVKAGCRQAGPKILFDLSLRMSDCCNNLHDGLSVPRVRTASSRSNLECPPGVNLKVGNIPETYNDITKSIIQGYALRTSSGLCSIEWYAVRTLLLLWPMRHGGKIHENNYVKCNQYRP